MAREAIVRECFSRLAAAVRVVPPELAKTFARRRAAPCRVTHQRSSLEAQRLGQPPSFASPGSDMSVHASGFGGA
jgi:hypothetical protein